MRNHPIRAVLCGLTFLIGSLVFGGALAVALLAWSSNGDPVVWGIAGGLVAGAAVMAFIASELSPTHPRLLEREEAGD